jgi:hypothetical protein
MLTKGISVFENKALFTLLHSFIWSNYRGTNHILVWAMVLLYHTNPSIPFHACTAVYRVVAQARLGS